MRPVQIDYTDKHEDLRDKLIIALDDIYRKFDSLNSDVYDFVAEDPMVEQVVTSVDSDQSTVDIDGHLAAYDHTKLHTRQHAIDATADHTSSITENNLMDADANGLPDDSGLTVSDVSDAVSKKHAHAYGSMYSISDMAITMTTQNVWYEIDAATAWVTGVVNDCTFTDPYITVTNAGTYLITWNIGARIGTANQVVRCGIMIDRTVTDNPAHGLPGVQGEGRGAFEFLNAARRLNTSGSAILTLAAGRIVSLAVRNLTSAAKVLTVGVGNLKVVQIG